MVEEFAPGPIVLFGSGETSHQGQKIFSAVMQNLPSQPRVALLETPAGFELNSARVAGRVAEFLCRHLQNYSPQVKVIPARRRGTDHSPDNPLVVAPMLEAHLIFLGPGSPTYAVRQLQNSLAWHILVARHRLGAPVVLASAAAIAAGALALPVYEIYKAGEDLHWKEGLDFFGPFGLRLVFIPHWNNSDGGQELDTSRCFMGQSRFAELMKLLPPGLTVVGIEENTALVFDLQSALCRVMGLGKVVLLRTSHIPLDRSPGIAARGNGDSKADFQRKGDIRDYESGQCFPMSCLGSFHLPQPAAGLPPEVWQQALEVEGCTQRSTGLQQRLEDSLQLPERVAALVAARETARCSKNWGAADALRQQIADLGYQVVDLPGGPRVTKVILDE